MNLKFTGARLGAFFLLLMSVLLLTALLTGAQSGRRAPAKSKMPTPVETPVPTPAPMPEEKKAVKPAYKLKVVTNFPLTAYSQILYPEQMSRWFVERLQSAPLFGVELGGAANRSDAVKMAKSATDTHIILFELDQNYFQTPETRRTKTRYGSVWINFYVFTPGTGKTKIKGSASPRPASTNAGVLNRRHSCLATLSNEEHLLLEASFEAAERIISGFEMRVPEYKCPRQF